MKVDSVLFKEIEKPKDKTGWIVVGEMKDLTYNPVSLESIPDAWCGFEFKIEVISYGSDNIILGSPELLDLPIDLEELKRQVIGVLTSYANIGVADLERMIKDSIESVKVDSFDYTSMSYYRPTVTWTTNSTSTCNNSPILTM